MKRIGILVVMLLTTVIILPARASPSLIEVTSPAADLLQTTGKITLLRVHDVGTGYGPPTDFIDVEVVIRLDSHADQAYGFQLRDDSHLLAHQGMLDLLRRAFEEGSHVTVDYLIESGKNNGILIRAWLPPFQRGIWLPLIRS